MIETDLDGEELACLGLRRVTDLDDWLRRQSHEALLAATPPPATAKRRVRRPTLASQLRQVWTAARAAGVHVAVTVEGAKVTAIPANGTAAAASDINEWDRDLGTNPPSLRQ